MDDDSYFVHYRIQSFYNLIYEEQLEVASALDISRLRKICFESGCPDDDKHIRSIAWKVCAHLQFLVNNSNIIAI